MDTSIASKKQLNRVKAQALFNIKSYCSEFKSYGAEGIEVDFDNEFWYLHQYNSIGDLEKVVQGILDDLNLWDCGGDDVFFDFNPDNVGIIYQIFRIFQATGHDDLVNKYKDRVIQIINDYFEARKSGECYLDDWDELYGKYLDSFIHSTFPKNEDTID